MNGHRKGKRMRISACVIVKNEEANLPRWLDCMKRIADELIVVDTGSADGTVAIAAAAGAHVEHFSWCNDFAAAKNFALSHAAGEWIVFLDADEFFPSEQCQQVRQILKRYLSDSRVVALAFRLINIDRETGQDQGTSMQAIRCFRNREWLRYQGAVHEQLSDLEGKGRQQPCYVENIIIYHTGYSAALIEEKLRRNLALLGQKMRDSSAEAVDLFHLADCHYGLGQYSEAADYARQAIEAGIEPAGQEDRPYSILVQSLILANRSRQEVLKAFEEAERRYPDSSKFPFLWGIYDWSCEAYYEAEIHFQRGMCLYRRESESADSRAGQSARFVPQALLCLGKAVRWKGQMGAALDYLMESLKLHPQNLETLRNLCLVLEHLTLEDVKSLFNSLYDRQRDGAFLAGVLADTKWKELSLYYGECSGQNLFDMYDRHLLRGDITAASGLLEISLRHLMKQGGSAEGLIEDRGFFR